MSSRHHIPFPSAFLSLNTPLKKSANAPAIASESELIAHGFLSNRPALVPRHSSISSVSSVNSATGITSAPATSEALATPVLECAVSSFLSLNTKYAAPPASAREMNGEKHGFLSNRH